MKRIVIILSLLVLCGQTLYAVEGDNLSRVPYDGSSVKERLNYGYERAWGKLSVVGFKPRVHSSQFDTDPYNIGLEVSFYPINSRYGNLFIDASFLSFDYSGKMVGFDFNADQSSTLIGGGYATASKNFNLFLGGGKTYNTVSVTDISYDGSGCNPGKADSFTSDGDIIFWGLDYNIHLSDKLPTIKVYWKHILTLKDPVAAIDLDVVCGGESKKISYDIPSGYMTDLYGISILINK